MRKYASKSPSRINKNTAAAVTRSKKKRTAMHKLVDDAIEHGATDEAKEKQKNATEANANKWKTFEQHVQDAAVIAAAKRKQEAKDRAKAKAEALRKSNLRKEAKRRIEESRKKKENSGKNEQEQERLAQERLVQERLARQLKQLELEERHRKQELEEREREREHERELELVREQQEQRRKEAKRKQKEAKRKDQEQQRQQQQQKEEAKEKAQAKERLLHQEQQKEKRLEQRKQEDPSFVERIPKRSALLAMGGKAAEAYKKRLETQALALWGVGSSGAGASGKGTATSTSNNATKWSIPTGQTFDGGFACESVQKEEVVVESIAHAIAEFETNPVKYVALYYPNKQLQPEQPITVCYIVRAGTTVFRPKNVRSDGSGAFCLWQHIYQRLKPFEGSVLPKTFRDDYTDGMTFEGKKLHHNDNDSDKRQQPQRLPLMPGRGMGLADAPNTKLMGSSSSSTNSNSNSNNDVTVAAEPNDIVQGTVGDCWLLSAIACLADFDWAVERIFRKTITASKHDGNGRQRRLEELPTDGDDSNNSNDDKEQQQHPPSPNRYVVTLWDLTTWKEVDIVIDERLPIRPSGNNKNNIFSPSLLGAKPSADGKLWVPYLEKAIAIHCGGYDKLVGGNCGNAWPMLTGSRNQYVIQKDPATHKYTCSARFDTRSEEWSKHTNSPHDSDQSLWEVPWPRVGSSSSDKQTLLQITADQLFDKIVAWDETNYLVGAGTDGRSDRESTDGIVDNHAYSVIDSKHDVGGTGIDLLLVRNPWGKGGGLQTGEFMANGPGWKKYPKVRYELSPINDDTGLFWLTRAEFFRYFPTIYLCKFNTDRLRDANYTNDLEDEFRRTTKKDKPKTKPKKPPKSDDELLQPLEPWFVNKQSDPNSPYEILEQTYDGGISFIKLKKQVFTGKAIPDAVEEFRAHPDKYLAIHFQNAIVTEGWPVQVHQYTFVYRDGTEGIQVDVVPKGKRTILTNVLR